MPKKYYTTKVDTYPLQLNYIIEAIRFWMADTILYTEETYTESKERFQFTDITVEQGGRTNIATWKRTELRFPFTCFNIGEPEPREEVQNYKAHIQRTFSQDYGCYVSCRPVIITMPMISFFATGHDYEIALKSLREESMTLSKLFVPVLINGNLETFPIEITMEISKGQYAFEFEQWLTSNRFFDIVHDLRIKYWDYSIDAEFNPVDSMTMGMEAYKDVIYSGVSVGSSSAPDIFEVTTTDPVDESTGVPVTQDITINFSNPILEDNQDYKDYIELLPWFDADYSISEDGKTITIAPWVDLDAATVYNITVRKELRDGFHQTLEEDFVLDFTTT